MNNEILAAAADKILKALDEAVEYMSESLDISESAARELLFENLLEDPRFLNMAHMAEGVSRSNHNRSFTDEKKE